MAKKRTLYTLDEQTLIGLVQLQVLGYAPNASAAIQRAVADALLAQRQPSQALLAQVAAHLRRATALIDDALIDPNASAGDDWPAIGSRTHSPAGVGVIVGYDPAVAPPYRVATVARDELAPVEEGE